MLKRLIDRIKHHRFCKRNRYYCPDCIYHDFVFDGAIFRGNRCRWDGGCWIRYKLFENEIDKQKSLKYLGDSICNYCKNCDCSGCIYEPIKGVL